MSVRAGQVVLGSLELSGVATLLPEVRRALFVPTAANGLPDRAAIVDAHRSPLVDVGWHLVDLDLEAGPATVDALSGVEAVCVSGGDPYRLLAAFRSSGFDGLLRSARQRGLHYVGMSAGAAVAGPSLDPLLGVTPFVRPAGSDTRALGLVPTVVLAHDDRPGRRQAHAGAQRRHGRAHHVVAITDHELLLPEPDGRWRLVDQRTGRTTGPAAIGDAAGIAATYLEAGREAWPFVPRDRFDRLEPPVDRWRQRIAEAPHRDDVLVVDDGGEVAGFIWVTAAAGPEPGVGEVGAFYTRPRLWGGGTGRRLLDLGLDRLRAAGCHQAVLFTEARNTRPRRVYERAGWRTDGAVRRRPYLGEQLEEVRYRVTL